MDSKIKYLVLDFGNVLACATTGEWFITPEFKRQVDLNNLDINLLKNSFKEYNYIISKKMNLEEEEYEAFFEFYKSALNKISYKLEEEKIKKIASNFVYTDDKYTFYNDVYCQLERLSKKYKLILLTDNWPCVERILKEHNIYNFFEKVYISSVYGVCKKDKVFFDYVTDDFDIKGGEALFVDDSEELVNIAKEKGFRGLVMRRENLNLEPARNYITKLSDIK